MHTTPYSCFKRILVFSVRFPGVNSGIVDAIFLVLVVMTQSFERFRVYRFSFYHSNIHTSPCIAERTEFER